MKKKLLSLALITLVYGGVNAQTTERLKEKFNTETANKNAFIDAIQMKGGSSFLHEKRTSFEVLIPIPLRQFL